MIVVSFLNSAIRSRTGHAITCPPHPMAGRQTSARGFVGGSRCHAAATLLPRSDRASVAALCLAEQGVTASCHAATLRNSASYEPRGRGRAHYVLYRGKRGSVANHKSLFPDREIGCPARCHAAVPLESEFFRGVIFAEAGAAGDFAGVRPAVILPVSDRLSIAPRQEGRRRSAPSRWGSISRSPAPSCGRWSTGDRLAWPTFGGKFGGKPCLALSEAEAFCGVCIATAPVLQSAPMPPCCRSGRCGPERNRGPEGVPGFRAPRSPARDFPRAADLHGRGGLRGHRQAAADQRAVAGGAGRWPRGSGGGLALSEFRPGRGVPRFCRPARVQRGRRSDRMGLQNRLAAKTNNVLGNGCGPGR
jgi:hypothetical protein